MQENPTIEIPLPTVHNFINRTGHVYGRLTVIRFAGRNHKSKALWECKCSCGKTTIVDGSCLSSGGTKSCGCYGRSVGKLNRKHGCSGTPIHNLWFKMLKRCQNPKDPAYNRYGGRGITVCKKWQDFQGFFDDMGERPKDRSLDRIDNDLGYWCGKCEECLRLNHPVNCRWATIIEQANNKRSNTMITFQGETLPLAQWATRVGIYREVIRVRLRRGWSVEDALTVRPVFGNKERQKHKSLVTLDNPR